MTNLTELSQENISGVAFNPLDLAVELDAYGECKAAELMRTVTKEQHQQISKQAMKILLKESCIIDKAICLAAIEVFFNESRPLNRKRRVYTKPKQ